MNPRPTRAEVSDVANAILDGAGCVILSGETAKGNCRVESVRTMHDVCILAEAVICYPAVFNELCSLIALPTGTAETIDCAAVSAVHEQNAGAVMVLSTSGNSARLLSKYRPSAPVIVVIRNPMAARQVHLYRGCFPFIYDKPAPSQASTKDSPQNFSPAENAPWQEDVDNRIMWGRYR